MEETEILVKVSNMLIDYASANNTEIKKGQMTRLLKALCNIMSEIKQSKILNSQYNFKDNNNK